MKNLESQMQLSESRDLFPEKGTKNDELLSVDESKPLKFTCIHNKEQKFLKPSELCRSTDFIIKTFNKYSSYDQVPNV